MTYSRASPYSRTPYNRRFASIVESDVIEFSLILTPADIVESDVIEFSLILTPADPVVGNNDLVSFSLILTPVSPLVSFSPAVIPFSADYTPSVLSKLFIALNHLDIMQFSVSKSVTDDIWAMNATIDGYQVINLDPLRHVTYSVTDHLGVSQDIFAGILPKSSLTIKETANKTSITGYDYSWYLARQTVPAAYMHNTAGTNPADIIRGILGGLSWEETTGIMPYNVQDVAGWGTTLNSRVFDFPVGTTKKQVIERICNYTRCIFAVKWTVVDGIATPAAYFISEGDIDTDLDLPDPVTFTYPDQYLIDDIKPVIKGDERYNRVTVIGRDNAGGVFTKSVESASVTNGDEIAVEYTENSGSWTTQAQVDARAAELYSYYSEVAYTYTATLIDRMDIELLQKIQITGYTGVSENWMRITKIKKTVKATKEGVIKTVDIEFTENVKWSALKRMYRYASDDIGQEIETIADYKISQIPGPQLGTVLSIDGQECDVTLESGQTITTRCV